MKIEYTITFPSGAKMAGTVNMDNVESRRKFAALAQGSLRDGATVTTRRIDKEDAVKRITTETAVAWRWREWIGATT